MGSMRGLVAVSLVLFGCGDDSANTDGGVPDGGPDVAVHDAATLDGGLQDGDPPDAALNCTVAPSLGDLGQLAGVAQADSTTDPMNIIFAAPVNKEATPDYVSVQLYRGYGVFAGSITTGTWNLATLPAELNYQTCGACVLMYGDVNTNTGYAKQLFMVTGGILTLTSVSGRLVGTLRDATFEHVTIDSASFESTPVGDGCETGISAASFEEPIQTQPGS